MTKREITRRITLALMPAVLLVALAGLVLVIQADGGPFAASSVVPTADEVAVGEEVGFALYVVNSGAVTATDVLVWNPLPPGTTYVSASGGAFPVVGGALSDLSLTAPPEGQAYDARLHTSALLADTEEVTGIAWVGDVPPAEMQVLGLIVMVNNPAGRLLVDEMSIYDDRKLAGQFSGQSWVPPYRMFLMLVTRRFQTLLPTPTTVTYTIPYGSGLGLGLGSVDEDYARALAGSDLNIGENGSYLGQSAPNGPFIPWYAVARVYAGWDTSPLPDEAEVLSATLVLDVGCVPPEVPFGATVYRGVWSPPLDENAWYALGGQPVGAWDTADYPCTGHIGSGQVRIALDPAVVNREGLTLLEMRSDREGTPPSAYEMINVTRLPDSPALVVTYVGEP